jgi:2-amino-4-hydroxy-6-hydroxymethyldihydropteridine diphosphokinase
MITACLALGSNLGDRWATLTAAIRRLRAEPGLRILHVSSFYETVPIDSPADAGMFLNAATVVETDRSPLELLRLLLQIERQFGRIRTEPNSPRTLDLDVLLCNGLVLSTPELVLPHPRMQKRAFVLVPLAEIAPDVVLPNSHKTVRELLSSIPQADREAVRKYERPRRSHGVLQGLRTLVTGSSSGIGRAVALAFAEAGADVLVHGRSPERLQETIAASSESKRLQAIRADLNDPHEVDRLANET